jgi:hypothetical protein
MLASSIKTKRERRPSKRKKQKREGKHMERGT